MKKVVELVIVRPDALLMGRRALLLAVLWMLPLSSLQAAGAADATPEQQAIDAARQVMDDFMVAFNSRDAVAWADTLLFPHVRVASGNVVVNNTKAEFVAATDLDEFARLNNWHHSAWDSVEVVQADATKVHFKVTFSRFNPAGEKYVSYNSLYILQQVDGRWGIRARSSFAP